MFKLCLRNKVILLGLVGLLPILGLLPLLSRPTAGKVQAQQTSHETTQETRDEDSAQPLQVHVVKPLAGGMERTTTQPGTIRAFEFEDVHAKVSGFLKNQGPKVDIGYRVKKGDVLAQIDAPELFKEEQHALANLEQAKANIHQMEACIREAESDLTAARALVVQRQAEILRAKSNLEFRRKQYERIVNLAKQAAVDDNLVDEKFEQVESARSWRDASEAAVNTALADVEAKKAKVTRAQADLSAAQARLQVAQSTLEKAQVYVEFTRIRSHYDGVVTKRNFHNGAFVRDPEHGGVAPLYTIQRTDLMRLVIQVPDTDAPFADPGDPVDLVISTLPEVAFPGLAIARIANSQDEGTRTMRVEADLPNGNGLLRDGMYGDVTLHLQRARKDAFRIPSSCLHREKGKRQLYVVRDNTVHVVNPKVGQDNGTTAEILSGLNANDLIIATSSGTLSNGATVEIANTKEGD